MNIQNLPEVLGCDATAHVLQPSVGDLVVLKVPTVLSGAQRDRIHETLQPMFDELGCKFLVLEGGIDLALTKKAIVSGDQP